MLWLVLCHAASPTSALSGRALCLVLADSDPAASAPTSATSGEGALLQHPLSGMVASG